jgi:hypothetical protein
VTQFAIAQCSKMSENMEEEIVLDRDWYETNGKYMNILCINAMYNIYHHIICHLKKQMEFSNEVSLRWIKI